jgi:hypothetical protein
MDDLGVPLFQETSICKLICWEVYLLGLILSLACDIGGSMMTDG